VEARLLGLNPPDYHRIRTRPGQYNKSCSPTGPKVSRQINFVSAIVLGTL